jgi:hypothetical protein
LIAQISSSARRRSVRQIKLLNRHSAADRVGSAALY